MSTELGLRLRQERERIGLSQADAAATAGVSREMWGRYERGAVPGADVLERISGSGFDVAYVVGGERAPQGSSLTNDERELLSNYRSTDDEGRAAIKRSAHLEAMRCEKGSTGAYEVRTTTALSTLHEPPPRRKPSS